MQPVTPLRQQHPPTNSRPSRISTTADESSSRRSSRIKAASLAAVAAHPYNHPTPPTPQKKDSLAPPLSLSRKRTRAVAAAEEEEQQHDDDANNDEEDEEEYGEDEEDEDHLTEEQADELVRQLNGAVEHLIDQENAIIASATQAVLPQLQEVFAKGRALYNVTSTTLAPPAELPNKRPRLGRPAVEEVARAPVASTSRRPAAVPIDAIATPRPTSRTSTLVVESRRPASRRPNAINETVITTTTTTASQSKRRSATKATTTAGDSASRRSKLQKEHDERRQQQEQDAIEWKKKYKRAFKTFVFYFDGFDVVRKREAEKCVRDLGAQVESFFSKQVSHVVTTRPIPEKAAAPIIALLQSPANTRNSRNNIFAAPALPGKENVQLPTQQTRHSSESPLKQSGRDAFGIASRRPKTRLGTANPSNISFPMKTPPKIKAFADFEKTESKDILVKAQSFGMKLWNVEKLQRVLERLMSDDSNPEAILRDYGAVDHSVHTAAGHAFNLQMNGNAPKQSLPSLLRAEAVSGSTYERDLSTFRPDFFYFNPKNGYILVEDTSGEYQPAHAKEYTQRIHLKPGEDSDRDTEWPTLWGGQEGRQAFYKPSATHKPPFPSRELIEANARGPEPVLTRSHKKPTLREPAIPEPASYLAASGNSQIITSNIQSGTSTRSGQVLGANAGKAAGNSLANGYIINKHLARLGSKNAHVVTLGSAKAATSSNAQHSAYVVEIAERAKASLMKRSVSLDTGLSLKQMPVAKPPRPEPKKPGYCENCRVRFDDFKSHTRSKKHRRFALDIGNWSTLDDLFTKLRRPINPELQELYDAAGCEVPSDIEASDKEEEDDYSDEEECDEEEDSGYASRTSDHARHRVKRRRSDTHSSGAELGHADNNSNQPILPDLHKAVEADDWETDMTADAGKRWTHPGQDDTSDEEDEEEDEDEEEEEDLEVVETSEEEDALETGSEVDDVA